MKKMMVLIAAAAAALVLAGCSSIDVATTFNNEKITDVPNAGSLAHLNGDIWGVYLFNLPLFSGSSKQPGRCAIFTDTVRVDNAVSMITRKANADFEGTTVTDITTTRTSTWLPMFLVLFYRDVQVSGNVIR